MKKLLIISFLLILTNCENNENNMTVKVNVENFKKGNVYLQKISDSALINIDSIFIKKNESIILKYNIFLNKPANPCMRYPLNIYSSRLV